MKNINITNKKFQEYTKKAPNIREINFWDLPHGTCVGFENKPENLRLRGNTKTITVGRLLRIYGKDLEINKLITFLLNWRNKQHKVNVSFPLSLIKDDYVKLYSLMLSEGSFRNEFKLQVPEKEFHNMFKVSLKNLFGDMLITKRVYNGVPFTMAPAKISHLLPIPKHIPKFILENKEFARIYLRIAFEAEGSLHLYKHKTGTHRRIKLSRNIGIDNLVDKKLPYKEGIRVYRGILKKEFPEPLNKITENPCSIILGEFYMLRKHFGVEARIDPEYIRINKTSHRRGKISVKWTLTIHAKNINKFIQKIGFITKTKREKAQKLLKIKSHRSRHFVFKVIQSVCNQRAFFRSDFIREMNKLGYVGPQCFLTRYKKEGKIKHLSRGKYLLLHSCRLI